MKKKSLLPLLALSLMYACNNESKPPGVEKKEEVPHKPKRAEIKDGHGCLSSAGYVWSEMRQECIRLWESATELEQANDWEPVVFVITSDSLGKAEVFFPEGNSRILHEQSKNVYTVDSLVLQKAGTEFSLALNGKVVYRTPSAIPVEETKAPRRRGRRK